MLSLLARAGALQYKHKGLFQPARAPVLGYKVTSLTDINTAPHTHEPVKHTRHSLLLVQENLSRKMIITQKPGFFVLGGQQQE